MTRKQPQGSSSRQNQDRKESPLLTTAARAIGSALGTVAAKAQQVIEAAGDTISSSGSLPQTPLRSKAKRSKRTRASSVNTPRAKKRATGTKHTKS
jgi:hypothetical protein